MDDRAHFEADRLLARVGLAHFRLLGGPQQTVRDAENHSFAAAGKELTGNRQ